MDEQHRNLAATRDIERSGGELIEKIKTPDLSHLSYLIRAGGNAAVIDPRRDCEIYVEKARNEGLRITHIFETHRNEDLVSGAPILAELTGAEVFHGPNADGEVVYAKTTREGDCHAIGQLEIRVLETPGHTYDHVAYAIFDSEYPDKAVGAFTGEALFVGDVGRTDFYPDRKREVAGLLFESLRKICELGDQAIIYPAHGAGSVCGSGMADREFSTIGHERRNNPMLQIEDRDAFIDRKVKKLLPATLFPADGTPQPGGRRGRTARAQTPTDEPWRTVVLRCRQGYRCPRATCLCGGASAGQHQPAGRHDPGLCRMVRWRRRKARAGGFVAGPAINRDGASGEDCARQHRRGVCRCGSSRSLGENHALDPDDRHGRSRTPFAGKARRLDLARRARC